MARKDETWVEVSSGKVIFKLIKLLSPGIEWGHNGRGVCVKYLQDLSREKSSWETNWPES